MSSLTSLDASSVIGLVESHVRHNNRNGPPRGYEIYHPSAFGKCLRMMQYQRYEENGLIEGKGQEFDARMLRLFENGHDMHDRWTRYFDDLGVLRGVWHCKNPLCKMFDDDGVLKDKMWFAKNLSSLSDPQKESDDLLSRCREGDEDVRNFGKEELIGVFKPDRCDCGCKTFKYAECLIESEEMNFRGHCDMILDFSRFDVTVVSGGKSEPLGKFFDIKDLPKKPIVVDMKTIGSNSYRSQVLAKGYHKYYGIQLTIYINILGLESGLLIYEEKDRFDISVYKIGANPGAWKHIKDQAKLMNEMVEHKLLPPPRPVNKSSWDCKGCDFKKHCQSKGGIWYDPELDKKREEFYGPLL